jgi:allantoinase
MFDLVIRAGNAPDIGIEGEFIAAVGHDLPSGKHEIDATRLAILPGMIDAHVHFNEPGRTDWEGAQTGSGALAAGGGTLFVDMPLNSSPCTVNAKNFDAKRAALETSSITDFALWGGIVPGNLYDMEDLAERGAVGFKAFMCDSGLAEFPRADDGTLYFGMVEAARLGLPVAVHAESDEMTRSLSHRLLKEGRHDIAAFLESRPVGAEVEAIRRAGAFARDSGCKLHIVHISSGSGVAAALEARRLGADITLETCPHYLFFSEEDLLRIGAVAKCAPPLRSAAEREHLRHAAQHTEIDIIGSDHSPCPPDMKDRENFFEIWGGIAGVQSTIPVLLDTGLSLERIAATTATNPALRFNLKQRGALQPGNYADIALVDAGGTTHVTEASLLHRHRTSPYAGCTLKGKVVRTIRRGETIFSEGVVTAQTRGRFVHA